MGAAAAIGTRTPWADECGLALRRFWVLGLFGVLLLPARGDTPAAPAAVLTAPQKASLAAVDRVIARYASALARDNDAGHQASSRAVLENLQRRRDALLRAFDQSKCDDLRVELILDFQRLAAWVGPPKTSSAAAAQASPP